MTKWYRKAKWLTGPAKRPSTSIVKELGYNEIYRTKTYLGPARKTTNFQTAT